LRGIGLFFLTIAPVQKPGAVLRATSDRYYEELRVNLIILEGSRS